MSKRVVVYMSPWCYTSKDTQSALNEWGVPATFINIKEDSAAARACGAGSASKACPRSSSPKTRASNPLRPRLHFRRAAARSGVDRGSMITEASRVQLRAWLVKHSFLAE